MEKEEFQKKLKNKAQEFNIFLSEEQINAFFEYMNLLIEWNQKMNLTAIVEPEEIITKHFIDSLTIEKYLKDNSNVLDIGTGAGFPGIPLAIYREKIEFCLVDSLQKRIAFLEEVKTKLNLKNIELVHARAEDIGRDKKYREKFDFVVSRAVAPLRILLEYMLPLTKQYGYSICMKGSKGKQEVEEASNAIKVLGGVVEREEEFSLEKDDFVRSIFILKKEIKTSEKYPRKAGIPTKQPL